MATPYYSANSSPGTGIPIVQGTYVPRPGGGSNGKGKDGLSSTATDIRNEPVVESYTQQASARTGCKDGIWAVLFYAHLIGLVAVTIKFAPIMVADMSNEYINGQGQGRKLLSSVGRFLQDGNGDGDSGDNANNNEEYQLDLDPRAIFVILVVCGVAGFIISAIGLSFMITCAKPMIKVALFFNLFMSGIFAIIALLSGAVPLGIMACLGFLFTAYYTYVVWSRIPFAASNLVAAATAIKSNIGLAFLAFSNVALQFLWALIWATAFVSTTYVLGDCQPDGTCNNEINGGITFLFFVSLYWTAQVVTNVVHVTVAGTVGTWWLHPVEANGCCSRGVRSSYWRSITTSFGSICLGSLIVALIQATREIVRSLRDDGEGGLLFCIADCLLSCIESLVEYFNKWAYVYVGLYGHSFMEASINVVQLFKSRGWSAIIADTMVDTVLFMLSLCGGLATGIIGVIMASAMSQGVETLAGAFIAGFLMGSVLSSTLFGLVSSATNAVIVLFAEAPQEFNQNHPMLSAQMCQAWAQVYPNEFNF